MAETLSGSATPREAGAGRHRPPDPAGTRPKVDFTAIRRPALAAPPALTDDRDARAADETDERGLPENAGLREDTTRPDDTGAAGLAGTGGRAGLGQTFGGRSVAATAVAATPSTREASRPRGTSAAAGGRAESPHSSRFQFLIGALIALGLSALVITLLTLRSQRDTTPTDWASWRPTATGFAAATQIANHVGPEYRLGSNAQMVAIQSGPLALDGVPLTLVLRSNASATANLAVLDGNAVLYKMCGLGTSCSIIGTPSAERLTLVRREALELALDTFEYVGNANQVVVFLPPVVPAPSVGAKKTSTTGATDALFFQAADFRSELNRPLSTTLSKTPTIGTVDNAVDTPVVRALTKPSFYSFSIVPQEAEATVFLVLSPQPLSP